MTLATHEEVVDAEIVRTHTEWAEVIKDDLGRAVEGIVSAGKHLVAAKADVNHGEWLPMLKEIGIAEAESRRLMAISRQFSNRPNLDDLPRSVSALYELSRLAPEDIESGIESGDINPNMKIKDAKAFASNEWPKVPPAEEGETEMPATLEHQSPFAAGETIRNFGNGTVITAGENGLAESTAESVTTALNWYRLNPTAETEDCEAATGVSERVAERSRAALIDNKEVPDPKPNRLVATFDSISQGLTYVADDLENMTADLERATAEDLEFGREYFEDAMKKLNAFRKLLNAKY